MELMVASYNVHECVGADGRCAPGRVAEVLGELGADLVALQEVRATPARGGGDDQARRLAEESGLTPVYGPTLKRGGSEYGNLLLISARQLAVRRHDLSLPGREPRGALDVDVKFGEHALRVVATHLGLARWERRCQVSRLETILSAPPRRPTLLLGDLNEWLPWGPVSRRLLRLLRAAPARRSFPARLPLLPLDRLFASAELALFDTRSHSSPTARAASDHLPVRARLRDAMPLAPDGTVEP